MSVMEKVVKLDTYIYSILIYNLSLQRCGQVVLRRVGFQ